VDLLRPPIDSAYYWTEMLEQTAQIIYQSNQFSKINILSADRVEELMKLRQKFNPPGRIIPCEPAEKFSREE
jgi:hypothetical protein